MYVAKSQFKQYANNKLIANDITGGDLTDEELHNLYLAWCLSPETRLKDFFNSFAFMTMDDIIDTFNISWEMQDNLDHEEICEYLAKEEESIESFLRLSNDLYLVRA